MVELTINQAKAKPANFLYIFADETYLSKLSSIRSNRRYAKIIRTKKANQMWLLTLSADKYKTTYNAYKQAIYDAFTSIYDMTPQEALIALAEGKNVAGKNWAKGVFGIGKTKTSTFKQNKDVTVDPTTGHIYYKGVDTVNMSEDSCVYGEDGTPMQFFYEMNGACYSSLKGEDGTFSAFEYEDLNGVQSALGAAMSAEDSASMWGSIIMCIGRFLEWLISLFGSGKETLNETNTLPNQQVDGYATNEPTNASVILIALVGAGVLLSGGLKRKKSKK